MYACVLQRKIKLAYLASLLSLRRCFVVKNMRWATSSIAHSLKKRPRFISVRISKLKETEHRVRNQPLVHNECESVLTPEVIIFLTCNYSQGSDSLFFDTYITLIAATIVVVLNRYGPPISTGPVGQHHTNELRVKTTTE